MNNKDYTIAETFTLPSLGKIYSTEIDPQVRLRSMSTADEMKRLSQTDYPYKTMCDIIKDCMIDDISIHPYDMCIGDYLFLLHKLRTVTYGPDYALDTICPYCGHSNNDIISLDEIPVKSYTEEVNNYFKFKLPKTGKEIEINYQTPRMLDVVSQRVKDFKKKSRSKELDPTINYTIAYLIKTIDGQKQEITRLEEWVKDLPMLDSQTILSYADKINQFIGLDLKLYVTCDVCTLTYNTSFRTTSEFFRPSLDI